MHTSLQFLSQKSVLLFGVALFVLADPFIYLIIGSFMTFIRSVENPGASFDTQDPFIQAMLVVSIIGFIIMAVSRVSAWILAFQKIKARSTK
jgi:hypothetical protein